LRGFADLRAGSRTQSDPAHSKSLTLGELRLQAHYVRAFKPVAFDGKLDLVFDAVTEEVEFDLRQLNLTFRPGKSLDLRLGRQIITWGTGDLIFINDLFPKDWQSFLSGRDDAYLKAPSNSLRLGWFAGKVSVDAVVTPRFEPDRYITGERLSFWDPFAGEFRGDDPPIAVDEPDDPEIALRVYGSAGSYELAGYGYRGFWKSPSGVDPVAGVVTFPELSVWGASGRGPLGPGIGNVEVGYYDSREDRNGRDPFVSNSEFRFLAGYELELAREFTGGFQYYVEHMFDYDAYRSTFPTDDPPRRELPAARAELGDRGSVALRGRRQRLRRSRRRHLLRSVHQQHQRLRRGALADLKRYSDSCQASVSKSGTVSHGFGGWSQS